ncbi:hypothetical protein XH92_28005 [Bradyrhizobium sp. CCBAU 53421]|nr:hypothetical protein XH92_28005 [Bradyrhizobium sp. CCBAU 53421]
MTGDRSCAAFVPRLRARAWNIPSPNARRKKPGLLAEAGLLKSKLRSLLANARSAVSRGCASGS